jgi:hypothetical protein
MELEKVGNELMKTYHKYITYIKNQFLTKYKNNSLIANRFSNGIFIHNNKLYQCNVFIKDELSNLKLLDTNILQYNENKFICKNVTYYYATINKSTEVDCILQIYENNRTLIELGATVFNLPYFVVDIYKNRKTNETESIRIELDSTIIQISKDVEMIDKIVVETIINEIQSFI